MVLVGWLADLGRGSNVRDSVLKEEGGLSHEEGEQAGQALHKGGATGAKAGGREGTMH